MSPRFIQEPFYCLREPVQCRRPRGRDGPDVLQLLAVAEPPGSKLFRFLDGVADTPGNPAAVFQERRPGRGAGYQIPDENVRRFVFRH